MVAGGDGRYHLSCLGAVHGVLMRGPSRPDSASGHKPLDHLLQASPDVLSECPSRVVITQFTTCHSRLLLYMLFSAEDKD